ncbi:hypothetical protein A6C57_01320 [Fibrella sp. ES10-3-2-2]|nr:hypothetical protein A6C57_01320 [Fibrella sp. ES10-3-2-2]
MSVTHSFSVNVAKVVGERKAVMLNNFAHWHKINMTDPYHCRVAEDDGVEYVWLYNSIADFVKLWPYLTPKEVRTALEGLEKEAYLKTGNFNEQARDRTKWYALTEKACRLLDIVFSHLPKRANANDPTGKCILPDGQLHFTVQANPFAPVGRPLPIVNSVNNPFKNTHTADADASAGAEGEAGEVADPINGKEKAPPNAAAPPPRRDPYFQRNAEMLNVPFSAWFALFNYNANREQAKAQWLNLTDEERTTAMAHTPAYVASRPEKQFRGFPNNYLSEKKFNNEIVKRDESRNRPSDPTQRSRADLSGKDYGGAKKW